MQSRVLTPRASAAHPCAAMHAWENASCRLLRSTASLQHAASSISPPPRHKPSSLLARNPLDRWHVNIFSHGTASLATHVRAQRMQPPQSSKAILQLGKISFVVALHPWPLIHLPQSHVLSSTARHAPVVVEYPRYSISSISDILDIQYPQHPISSEYFSFLATGTGGSDGCHPAKTEQTRPSAMATAACIAPQHRGRICK